MKPLWHKLFPLLLIAAGFLAYHNSFSGVFILDDGGAIVNNERIHSLWPSWAILFDVRPFLNLTLALNYAIGGKDVWGYHAVNLLIHLGAGLVLFGIVRRSVSKVIVRSPNRHPERSEGSPDPSAVLRPQDDAKRQIALASPGTLPRNDGPWLAFTISLLWLVHPLQTQSVTYLIQRAESLMGLFYLWTLYGVIRGAESPRNFRWYLVAIVSFILGMETKEVMVTAPFVILLYDRIFLASSWKEVFQKRWGIHLGLLVSLGLAMTILVFYYRRMIEPTAGFALEEITPLQYAFTQPGVILHYLRLAFWPHPLVLDYHWPIARNVEFILFPALVIGLLLGTTVFALRYRPPLGFLGLWFFLILAPTSSVMPIADIAFEHRMYLPLAAPIALAVMGGKSLAGRLIDSARFRQGLAIGLLSLITATFTTLTIRRNEVYHSEIAMWLDTAHKRPKNPRPYNSIGMILANQGKFEEARTLFSKAIELNPKESGYHSNLGNVFRELKKYDESLAHYQEALRLKPASFGPLNNMGNVYRDKGDLKQAELHYRKALELKLDSPQLHNNLGIVLMEQGNLEEAASHYQEAARLAPGFAEVYNNLGLAFAKQGRIEEAVRYFNEAIRINPDFPEPRKNLAVILESQSST